MRKRLTPKEKLIARLKAEGIIPESHTIHIEVMRWSTYRRDRSSAVRSDSLCPYGADARFYYSAAPSGDSKWAGCEGLSIGNRAALNVIAIFAANS